MRGFRFWPSRHAHDDDLDRELKVHLALEVEEQLERGLPLHRAKEAIWLGVWDGIRNYLITAA